MRKPLVLLARTVGLESEPNERLALLGSTGSIGRSTLDVVRLNPERFRVVLLAGGRRAEDLASQVLEFRPKYVFAQSLTDNLLGAAKAVGAELSSDNAELCEWIGSSEIDTVCSAIVGRAGLESTLAAVKAGKKVALANKESLALAGKLISEAAADSKSLIVPVDSEHCAIYQALLGSDIRDVDSLILTASGGPFLNHDPAALKRVTPEEAVKHPRWSMGPKISVESAAMINKALELIEAYWLFGVSEDRIEVVVHPESIVHSLVRFIDGSELAQLSVPDMRGPISFALSFPGRRARSGADGLSLAKAQKLSFLALDSERFPAVNMARDSLSMGGAGPAVFCRASEVAVLAFLERKIGFTDIVKTAEAALNRFGGPRYHSLEGLLEILKEVDTYSNKLIAGGF